MGQFTLYTYFRSSCAARLRITLNLKLEPYEPVFVNLLKGEHLADGYDAVNPNKTVPVLVSQDGSGNSISITQSLAALEYLEESLPGRRPLLPSHSNPTARARVREIACLIASDIQPVTNMRTQKKLQSHSVDGKQWSAELAVSGFTAVEKLLAGSTGKFCVGDEISLADVCLVPAVWAAQRLGVDIGSRFPTVNRIFETMLLEEAVQKAHWQNQPDTPEELRPK